MNIKKIVFLFGLLLLQMASFAQEAAAPAVEMATELRSSGKIYVVVAVLLIIFAGIAIYLTRLDRKISKLENEIKK